MNQKTQGSPKLRVTPEVAAAILADRCRADGALARKLQDDPRGALAELNGQKVPEYMNVAVHQNAPDHWHIVIPSDKQAQRRARKRRQDVARAGFPRRGHRQAVR